MKICVLADVQSAHTKRWLRSISEKGHEVICISFRTGSIAGVQCYTLKTPSIYKISPTVPAWARFHYLFGRQKAQEIINEFNPDIVHAFWATSYGFLGARLKTKRFLLSVWGADITDSPKNLLMRLMVRFALKKAEKIFCTSEFLLNKTREFVDRQDKLVHIPFGVDTAQFYPLKKGVVKPLVIGSTKSFEPKYGLLNLIKAFGEISKSNPAVELLLVGSGSLKKSAEEYINQHLPDRKITLLDAVDVDQIPELLNKMDIYVMPSVSESETFGVAAVEASACGIPVIGSRIGGIPEVVQDGVTGYLIAPDDIADLSAKLNQLIGDGDLREKMGAAGRNFVEKRYFWDNNVDDLLGHYTRK